MSVVPIIDSHCHLDDTQFSHDRDEVVERALAAGVATMLAIGTGDGPPDLEAGIRMAERYECIVASAGVHPHDASKAGPGTWPALRQLLNHPKVVALGEIGLDYHYNFSPPDVQRAVFAEQLAIARQGAVPIIIHAREAWDDTFQMLEKSWAPGGLPGIMHCFSGGPEEAGRALAMGFLISFAGIVTYPRALNVQAACRLVPDDRLLIETDAPYLAPAPKRGKRNEPALVVETLKKVAELRGQDPATVARLTTSNFERLCARPAASGLPRRNGNS